MVANGNIKWYAGIIITILLCVLTFLGGRWSISSAIVANATTNKVQDEQIANLREIYKNQSIKIDDMYKVIMTWKNDDASRPRAR